MICLLPTSPRKIRNDGEAVTPPPFLNPTTCIESGESMGKANSVKLSLEERKARRRESQRKYREANREKLKASAAKYRRDNKKKIAAYRDSIRDRIAENNRAYNAANREVILDQQRKYRESNKEKVALGKKKYRENNRESVKKSNREYIRTKRQSDPVFKIVSCLRHRLYLAVLNSQKAGSAVRDMGCTGQEACDHLESLFDENMTWENWGTYWHVDHIFPLAAANKEDRAEFLAVNNWRNLQPLEAKANMAKGDKVTPAARRLFNKLVKEFS